MTSIAEPIVLPPGVAIGVLAFLLSLLPAALFVWLWYLRRQDRPVPAGTIGIGFALGMVLVVPAFFLERQAPVWWTWLSPSTAHYFDGALLPLQTVGDILLPAVGTFIIIATIEEGLRYLGLFWWFRKSKDIDQVFDGLLVGIAAGLGFATVENTLYFFQLFTAGSFNTLVFVFFLRFLVSTLAHVSFGGLMGALLARATFSIYRPKLLYWYAFLLPWFLHGLYDWLLAVNQVLYAVLALVVPLAVLVIWSNRRELLVINRDEQGLNVMQQSPRTGDEQNTSTAWNKNAPWLASLRSNSEQTKKRK